MMVPFVELNTDGTPIGLLTVQKDMRVIKSRQSIDPSGLVSRHRKVRACVLDCANCGGASMAARPLSDADRAELEARREQLQT